MPRLLLVSNRLPVTVKADARGVTVTPSSGGLATGLRGPHQKSNGLWLGWPGDVSKVRPERLALLEQELAALKTVPIHLSPSEVARYYDGFSNGVLWPLFHYVLDRVPIDSADWTAYRRVNERFADLVAKHYEPGDLVWVHDYQLVLVPALLRERIPDAKIGFFLHIPFPATDVFRILPWREEVLAGILGADLVGFHTFTYLRHFAKSIVRTLDASFAVDRVNYDDRTVHLGVFPMGIDVAAFEELSRADDVMEQVRAWRAEAPGQKIVLGIDRLDYTKGIHRRLLAIERLLEREPQLRGRVRFIQLAVPSREKIDAYAKFRRQVEETVGRINGAYGTVSNVPIHYLYRSMSERQVTALYRAADVMMVTPLRDGMNLVAKEYVAARTDGDGVLVLSEFAGASYELGEAMAVNAYDIDGIASAMKRALLMPEAERRSRMRSLRARVTHHDVHRWAEGFIGTLDALPRAERSDREASSVADLESVVLRARAAKELLLLLDYDGTLVPLAPTPDLAAPSGEVLALLEELSRRPSTTTYVVSGRLRESLDRWLGELPLGLYAEHGMWRRLPGERAWTTVRELLPGWKEPLRPILARFTERTPGSFFEEKTAGYAWHYRLADAELGPLQAKELTLHLTDILSNAPVIVQRGHKVIEVRQQDVHKGIILPDVLARTPGVSFVIAAGDDRTDEDLFAALPDDPARAAAVKVGSSATRARLRVSTPAELHRLLRGLL